MFNGMIHAHSGLRWILLILIIVSVANALKKWKTQEVFNGLDNKLSLITMIVSHIQLLLGIYLYIKSPKVMLSGIDMSDKIARFFTIEHSIGMVIAIILITVARIQIKKITTDALKHKKIFVYFLIALILILVSIPWPFRGLASGWF